MPKIRKSVKLMSADLGNKISDLDDGYYSFPTPEAILNAGSNKLKEYSVGYRSEYIYEFARDICLNGTFLSDFSFLDDNRLIDRLKEFKGIGTKVANCIALFGFHRMNVFPVDVHIRRFIDNFYSGNIDLNEFNGYAGYVQQCIFYRDVAAKKKPEKLDVRDYNYSEVHDFPKSFLIDMSQDEISYVENFLRRINGESKS
jgi:N-glycosylase/DNA lyase